MTVRYVGIGGSDANSGLTWALRKLTLNGAEDTPVVAGDTIYVGPGTYRELLTVDVSGTAGNPITYIGDYTGANTDGVGGVVRITGSNNDQTATRANCITGTTKDYRTFQGFTMDTATAILVNGTNPSNWIIQNCFFNPTATACIDFNGATQTTCTIQNCLFNQHAGQNIIILQHTAVVDNVAHVIQNCVFLGGANAIRVTRVGGFTVKNCYFTGRTTAISVGTAITVGQTITVNNCILQGCSSGFVGTVTGEIVENYNSLFANTTDRTNTATGANSNAYPALFDTRWFFQMVTAGAGPNDVEQLVSPFDLSSLSQLLNVAGTSPTTTDMRGTAVQGAQREWGALEYDSTLKIAGGGGGISRARAQG